MMVEDFIKLNINEKANFVWKNGILLDNHVDREKSFNLYYLPKFYVEVAVSNEDERLLEIIGFVSTRRLEKYLKKIHLGTMI